MSNSAQPQSIKITPAMIGSLLLIIAFCVPWITFLGSSVPGYQIQKIWDPGYFAWASPVAAAGAIVLGLMRRKSVWVAQIAGAIPLALLAFALVKFGKDVFEGLLLGAYITLGTGLFLVVVAPRLEDPKEA